VCVRPKIKTCLFPLYLLAPQGTESVGRTSFLFCLTKCVCKCNKIGQDLLIFGAKSK
jgi:hypothetical protein